MKLVRKGYDTSLNHNQFLENLPNLSTRLFLLLSYQDLTFRPHLALLHCQTIRFHLNLNCFRFPIQTLFSYGPLDARDVFIFKHTLSQPSIVDG